MKKATIHTLSMFGSLKSGPGAEEMASLKQQGEVSNGSGILCLPAAPDSGILSLWSPSSGSPLKWFLPYPPLSFPETQVNFLLAFQAAKFNFASQI